MITTRRSEVCSGFLRLGSGVFLALKMTQLDLDHNTLFLSHELFLRAAHSRCHGSLGRPGLSLLAQLALPRSFSAGLFIN